MGGGGGGPDPLSPPLDCMLSIIPLVIFLDFFGGDGNGSLNPDVEAFSGDILLKGNFVFN